MTLVNLNGHDIQLPKHIVDSYLCDINLDEPLDGKLNDVVEQTVLDFRCLTVTMKHDETMQVPVHILKKFKVVRSMLEDLEDIQQVPLSIEKSTLDYAIALMSYDDRLDVKDEEQEERVHVYESKAAEAFTNISNLRKAVRIIADCYFIDYEPLANAAATYIAKSIKGLSEEDTRKAFGIKRNFTKKERNRVLSDLGLN